jgi:hypothetical protein
MFHYQRIRTLKITSFEFNGLSRIDSTTALGTAPWKQSMKHVFYLCDLLEEWSQKEKDKGNKMGNGRKY